MSAPPPAPNEMMKWIACCGQLCAKACVAAVMKPTKTRNSRRLMASLRPSTKLYHIVQNEPRLQRGKFGASTSPSGSLGDIRLRQAMSGLPSNSDISDRRTRAKVIFVLSPVNSPGRLATIRPWASTAANWKPSKRPRQMLRQPIGARSPLANASYQQIVALERDRLGAILSWSDWGGHQWLTITLL